MKLLHLLVLLVFVALPALATAATTRLSAADRRRLESPARVEMLRSMRGVPADVVRACAAAMCDGEFVLTDPGQRYQATDFIDSSTRNLPWRRLRWAAHLTSFYVIHYEKGGIGHSVHILLVRANEGVGAAPARLVWSAVGDNVLKDYDRFVAALRAGQLDDDPAYIH